MHESGAVDRLVAFARLPMTVVVGSVLTAVVVVALYLQESGRSYGYDESLSVARFISTGPRTALTTQVVFNNHPVFSVIQSLLWKAGGTTETWQRTLPVLYSASAVGLMMWAIGRRVNLLAGLAAAAVVAANPMFASQGRQVRGYSLAALAVVVAAVALVEYLVSENRLWLLPHGVAATIGVGTHLYAAIAFACVGAAVVAWLLTTGRRVSGWLIGTWAVSAVSAALIYMPTIDDMLDASSQRGSRYTAGFGADVVQALLGQHKWAVWSLGLVIAAAIVAVALRARPVPGLAVAGSLIGVATVAILVIWQVLRPYDLYARFLVVLLPAVGVACAVAVARWPVLVALVVVAVGGMTLNNFDVWSRESPNRQAAELLARAQARGVAPCVLGGEALAAYTPGGATEILDSDQLPGCGIYVEIGSWGKPLRARAAEIFDYEWRIEGAYSVYANTPRNTFEEGGR